jgi:hypothetical protein
MDGKYLAKFAKKFVENMMHDHPTVSAPIRVSM